MATDELLSARCDDDPETSEDFWPVRRTWRRSSSPMRRVGSKNSREDGRPLGDFVLHTSETGEEPIRSRAEETEQLSDSGFMSQQPIRAADDRHLLPAGATTPSS